ncbi:MAG: VOC family protein [Caulobacteraceae bacterium]
MKTPDLEAAVRFYADALGHQVIWRTQDAVGLKMGAGEVEIVLRVSEGPETDLLVDSVDDAFARFLDAGGQAVAPPFEIPVGRCAIVCDPFGNTLVMLDQSKGAFVTDHDGRVVGVGPR